MNGWCAFDVNIGFSLKKGIKSRLEENKRSLCGKKAIINDEFSAEFVLLMIFCHNEVYMCLPRWSRSNMTYQTRRKMLIFHVR